MKKSSICDAIKSVFGLLLNILPVVFWLCVIYSFDEKMGASITILAMIIHEFGHVICIFCFTKRWQIPRGSFNGLRITKQKLNSYPKEILQYASGIISNLIAALCMVPYVNKLGDYATLFITINLATALSNFLPIDGYDGYKIFELIIEYFDFGIVAHCMLEFLSFTFILTMCITSLFLVYTFDNGYWFMLIFLFATVNKLQKWQNAYNERPKTDKKFHKLL